MNNEIKISVSVPFGQDSTGLKYSTLNDAFCGKFYDTNVISLNVTRWGSALDIVFSSDSAVPFSSAMDDIDAKKSIFDFYNTVSASPMDTYELSVDKIFYKDGCLLLLPSLIDNGEPALIENAMRDFVQFLYDNTDKKDAIQSVLDFINGPFPNFDTLASVLDDAFAEKVEPVAFESKRVCPNCGAEYVEDYMFCIKCGTMLNTVQIPVAPAEEPAPLPDPEPVSEMEPTLEKIPEVEEIEEQPKTEEAVTTDFVEYQPDVELEEDVAEEVEAAAPKKKAKILRVIKKNADVPAPVEEPVVEPEIEPAPVVDPISEPKPQPEPVPEPTPEPIQEPEPIPEPESIPVEQPESVKDEPAPENVVGKAKSNYAPTTLLGFTNFGETAVLGGFSATMDTPNLVRLMNDEKVYISKRSFVVGKSADCDYSIKNNPAISRIHAEICVSGSEYTVVDKGSTNHTYINGQMIQPNTPAKISDGDEIKFANELFKFYLQ